MSNAVTTSKLNELVDRLRLRTPSSERFQALMDEAADTIDALRSAALSAGQAQPVQEAVGWFFRNNAGDPWQFSTAEPEICYEKHRAYSDAQPIPEVVRYAERLAISLWEKHWKNESPEWKPLTGDLIGILTQIDNMTAGLVRPPPAVPAEVFDLQDIIFSLEEAQGFAAMSPGGRDNIASALERLEEAAETTYRKGFVDGEQHAVEHPVPPAVPGEVTTPVLSPRPSYCKPRRFLLLASYCGDDTDGCTDGRPCADCLAMCNIYGEDGEFISELGALSVPLPEVEGEAVECAARRQGTVGGNDPADCDWPFCGCDTYADKVIAALQECGWSAPPRNIDVGTVKIVPIEPTAAMIDAANESEASWKSIWPAMLAAAPSASIEGETHDSP